MAGSITEFFSQRAELCNTVENLRECVAFTAWALHTPITALMDMSVTDLVAWCYEAARLMQRIYGDGKKT